jgi:hypothetical protein
MMNILKRDYEYFIRQWPSAAEFLRAAFLRKELLNIEMTQNRNEWDTRRRDELSKLSCCNEDWFLGVVNQYKGDM